MVHVIKVQFEDSNKEKQIRRLAVSSDVASNFKLLKEKVLMLFQLESNSFNMTWKDSDNDFILMSSDEELAQALANSEDGLLRVYLSCKNGVHTEPKTAGTPNSSGVEHRLVTCDGCEKDLYGDRYKCLQCSNYDLCSTCNMANKHPDHDMLKLVKPTNIPREWLFGGSRKLWKCMFDVCPRRFFMHQQNKDESASSSKPTDNSPKSSPEDCGSQNKDKAGCSRDFHGFSSEAFLNNFGMDFAEAQKIFTKAAETFVNILPGGIEVQVGRDPFTAECKVKTTVNNSNGKKSESAKASSSTKEDEKVVQQEKKADVQPPPKEESAESKPVPAQPKTEKAEVPHQPKYEEVAKPIPVQKSGVDESKVPIKETTDSAECRDQSPTVNLESSACTDDWTFIHEDETTKQEPACAAEACAEVPTEAAKDVQYPKLDGIKDKLEDGNVIQTNDTKIINALIKMQAMGFTNEGGWLEKLLITKHGNINEALDALYPNAQRH